MLYFYIVYDTYVDCVDCCRHQNNLDVRIHQLLQYNEEKVHILIPLMHLIQNDVRVFAQWIDVFGRANELLQQHAGGTEQNSRVIRLICTVVQANLQEKRFGQNRCAYKN